MTADKSIVKTFKSKKNTVHLIREQGRLLVAKKYSMENKIRKNMEIYVLDVGRERGLRVPQLIMEQDNTLYMSYVPGQTAMDMMEDGSGAEENVRKVALWLAEFHKAFSSEEIIMGDCNLRNFILGEEGDVTGVDFEEARTGDAREDVGVLCAHILSKGDMFSPHKIRLCEAVIETYFPGNQNPCQDHDMPEYIALGLEYFGKWRPDGPLLLEKAQMVRKGGLEALLAA